MRVPEVLVGHRAVAHDHLELPPDGVATRTPVRARRELRADPDDLVLPGLAGAVLDLAVPVVGRPGVGVGRVGPALVVAADPVLGPLHVQLVVGVRGIAPHQPVVVAVHAVGRAIEDPSLVVVAPLVEPASGVGHTHDNREQTEHRQELSHRLDAPHLTRLPREKST